MRRASIVVVAVLAIAILVPSAAFADGMDPREGRVHGMLATGIGFCSRSDLYVGGTGFCGELSAGLWTYARNFDFLVELGAGSTTLVKRDDPGLAARGGGAYFFARKLYGVHFGPGPFPPPFFRVGPELRVTAPFGSVEMRPQVAAELGLRFDHLQFGARAILGVDATRTKLDTAFSGSAFVYEMGIFVRLAK